MEYHTYMTTDYKALEAELKGTELLLFPYNTRRNTARNATIITTWLSDTVYRHTVVKPIRTRPH